MLVTRILTDKFCHLALFKMLSANAMNLGISKILSLGKMLTTSPLSLVFTMISEKASENMVGKGENAGFQNIFLFSKYFLFCPEQISIFESCLSHLLQNLMLSIWTDLKFCCLVQGLF